MRELLQALLGALLALLLFATPALADSRIETAGRHGAYATSTVTDVTPLGAVGYNKGVPYSPPPQRAFSFWDWRIDYQPLDGYRDSVFTSLSDVRRVGYASTADNSAYVGIYSCCGGLKILPASIAAYGVDGNTAVGKDESGRPAYWQIADNGNSVAGPYILASGVGAANAVHGDTIVGSSAGYAVKWVGAIMCQLDSTPGEALDFSEAGIIGRRGTELGWWSAPYDWHALPDEWAAVSDISDSGLIVGVADGQAAIYDDGTTYALYDWFQTHNVQWLAYWDSLWRCNAISDDGTTFGGQGLTIHNEMEGFIVRTPEPGSVVLLLAGCAALWRRR